MPHFDRRHFLGLVGTSAAATSLMPVTGSAATPLHRSDLFTLGVSSGEPTPDGIVLWTRLALDPVAVDGHGGMPQRPVPVKWELATEERFTKVVRRGTAVADPDWGHSIHVEVDGLQPGRDYWYRFRVGDQLSPVGHTRTAPAPGAANQTFDFAFASCQNYPAGHFTALGHMAAEDLDLIIHLGDYIYEGSGTGSIGRAHLPDHETVTLADYRVRYGQYKSDPDLLAAHASAPWVMVPDDHEVENNWAGDQSQPDDEPDQDPEVFRQRRAAAFKALYENLPFRAASMPKGPDMQLYRRLRFGQLAELNMIDTRQYRANQLETCSGDCPERWDAGRTMLGDAQEKWLYDGMNASTATWNIIGNQIVTFGYDRADGDAERYPLDNWNGYAAARQEMYEALSPVDNVVVITGDAHKNIASDLLMDFRDQSSEVFGTEFLGTSVSSSGDGRDAGPAVDSWLRENPHIKFANQQRGYQRVHVTPERWQTDYKVVPYATRPDAPISTRAAISVEAGRPGIADISENPSV